jgi:dihydroorotate dehydrogenase (NAD+) catalytic subunit
MKSWPSALGIKSPFTIPSGVLTTLPSVIALVAREVPEVGFLTTKTLSVAPREGYREPIIHEYYPGCFVNAVGLANPGAREFLAAMSPLLPLHDGKPLFVSIMGADPEEFLECATILDPIADAFELNLSCPHVKGAGQAVGSDPNSVQAVIRLLKEHFRKPVIPKLSPNLGDIPRMACLCRDAGADGLSLINTVGPGIAVDYEGNAILTNVVGGLSGAGIFPIGLRAVREASAAVDLPIIASGGITSAGEVRAYRDAGASFFAVGSALAGMSTPDIVSFFRGLDVCGPREKEHEQHRQNSSAFRSRTTYHKAQVMENEVVGPDMFRITLSEGLPCDPGCFFFLRLPGAGEKPFSPMCDKPHVYLVRAVGPFTRSLQVLRPGDVVYLRGPYGQGFAAPENGRPLILVAGGTGVAPIVFAALRWSTSVVKSFVGFSKKMSPSFVTDLNKMLPGVNISIDSPGQVGEVLRSLVDEFSRDRTLYAESCVFMCGPTPMMEAAGKVFRETVPTHRLFTAREDVMRCGIGLCGSCGTKSGLRSCVDGPVMSLEI